MPDGRHKKLDSVTFDASGKITERTIYDDYGFLVGKEIYSYDSKGNLTKTELYDSKGAVEEKRAFTYGVNNKPVRLVIYDGKGADTLKQTYSYDEKGNLREEVYYEQEKPVGRTSFKSDERGNIAEVAFYLADGSKAVAPVGPCFGAHRVVYAYNSKNELIEKTAYEINGSVKRKWSYVYDGKGNITEDIRVDEWSTLKFDYTYEYDSNGNWIEQTSLVRTSRKPLEGNTPDISERKIVTIRNITYY